MSVIAYALYLVICGGGCTEVPIARELTMIDCLIAGKLAVERGEADNFTCRLQTGQEA